MGYVGIVYDGLTRRLRRIVLPDRDIDLDYAILADGEIMARMPKSYYTLITPEQLRQAFDLAE